MEFIHKNPILCGSLASLTVIAVWSNFIVLSRLGVTSGLTGYDVAFLRYSLAGLLVLPFAYKYWPRGLKTWQIIALLASGPGAPYAILTYYGLTYAPASYGGVFTNGFMPICSALIAFLWFGERLGWRSMIGIAFIVSGGMILGLMDGKVVGPNATFGIVLFLIASLVISAYLVAAKRWGIVPIQAIIVSCVPSMFIMWILFAIGMPSTLDQASWQTIITQMLFQGVFASIVGGLAYIVIVITLGATVTAGVSAVVPATAAILAIPVLSEWPSAVQWVGIAIVSLGLLILLVRGAQKSANP